MPIRTASERPHGAPGPPTNLPSQSRALRDLSALLEAGLWSDLTLAAGSIRGETLDLPAGDGPGELARRVPPKARQAVARALEGTGLLEAGGAPEVSDEQLAELVEGRFADLAGGDPERIVAGAAVMPVVVVDGTQAEIRRFLQIVATYTAEPAPAADDPGTRIWVDRARRVLKEAYAVVTNILVAAAFSLPSVQEAAQRTTSSIAAHLPALLAISIMAVLGVRLARDLGHIQPAP